MAAVNGTLYAIFSTVGTVATATVSTDKVYSCKTATVTIKADTPDASSKESGGWWEGIPGQKDVTLSFSGPWDEAGSATALTASEIMTAMVGANAARKFAFVPAALGTSIPGWMGMGIFDNMSITADNEQPCSFSGSVKGTGAWSVFTA